MRFYRPITGATRTIRKFAWYPIYVNGVVYWFEWVTVHQTYNTRHRGWNNDWR